MTAELSLVLGAGQVGPMVAERLLAAGQRVRIGRRQPAPSRVEGVENVTIDVRDAASVARAAAGAGVVYHCVNPLYPQWPEMLLPMTRGIVEGTARAGARLVVLDNLYMYGDNRHMSEDTPVAPVSKKGALRVQAAELMLDADARGTVPVAIGRAADFFGPHTPLSMAFGEFFFQRVLAGKSALLLGGDPDMPHSYSYTPDVAAGLVALGQAGARGVWMLPVQPAETTRAVMARFARVLGRSVDMTIVPQWVLRTAGVFWQMGAEIAEMTYQWRQPYVLDDARFRAHFGLGPTGWEDAVEATVAWGRRTYAPGRGASAVGDESVAHAA
jgi:nucleoside-diphosphate-sugar epimerase